MKPILVLRHYDVYQAIAKGGQAAVHFARVTGGPRTAQVVAVKRMHPALAEEPDARDSLYDEARIVARVDHPNVVPLLDVVEESGELILVMPLIRGQVLSRLGRQRGSAGVVFPVDIAAGVVAQALRGLHAAHEARDEAGNPLELVHRDISPHNIIVGADGIARVLDFGIAKAAQRLQKTTRTGELKGKIAYMAPEQFQGSTLRQTDVYAAGVVLWEALTGARLFDAENEAQLIMQVMQRIMPRPSELTTGLSEALNRVVMRALSYEADARFPTALAMAEAIERAVPVASPAVISAWVELVAGADLAKYDAVVRAIGSDVTAAHLAMAILPAPRLEPSAPRAELTSVPGTLSVTAGPAIHRGRVGGALALATASAVGGLLAFMITSRGASPHVVPASAPVQEDANAAVQHDATAPSGLEPTRPLAAPLAPAPSAAPATTSSSNSHPLAPRPGRRPPDARARAAPDFL